MQLRTVSLVCVALVWTSACSSPATEAPPAEPAEEAAPPAEPTLVEPTEAAAPTDEAPAEPEGFISREMLGDEWPFTVESGVLACEGSGGAGAVTFTADGTTYAVNGTARGQGAGAEIDAIWAADPSIPGTKKDISVAIERGLALCK